MTALDLLFVLGQVLVLVSLIYFFYLVIGWQMHYTAAFRASGRYPEQCQSDEPPVTKTESVAEDAEHSRHREIAPA